jgi:hypothetical protein
LNISCCHPDKYVHYGRCKGAASAAWKKAKARVVSCPRCTAHDRGWFP